MDTLDSPPGAARRRSSTAWCCGRAPSPPPSRPAAARSPASAWTSRWSEPGAAARIVRVVIVGLVVVLALIGRPTCSPRPPSACATTRDIAVLRAMGLTPRQVTTTLVTGTGMLALIAVVAGIGAGPGHVDAADRPAGTRAASARASAAPRPRWRWAGRPSRRWSRRADRLHARPQGRRASTYATSHAADRHLRVERLRRRLSSSSAVKASSSTSRPAACAASLVRSNGNPYVSCSSNATFADSAVLA